MKNLLLTCFLCLPLVVFAQPTQDQVAWERCYGDQDETDELFDLIQDYQGRLVFTGTTGSKNKKLLLGIVRATDGQLAKPLITIDHNEETAGRALLQRHDGRLAVVGFATGKKGYGQDALLCQFDENGRLLQDTILISTRGDDRFEDLAEDNLGNLYLAGKTDGHLAIAKWTQSQELQLLEDEEVRTTGPSRVVIADDGKVYLLGQIKENTARLYYADFKNNQLQVIRTFEEMISTDLIATADDNLLVGGYTLGMNREDVCLSKVDPSGKVRWQRTLGARGEDYAFSVLEHPNGLYLVAGASTSYAPGAGRTQFYLQCVDQEGNTCWGEPFYHGGTEEDKAQKVIALQNGNLVLGGMTASNILGRKGRKPDLWVSKLAIYSLEDKKLDLNLSGATKDCQLAGGDGNSVLSVGERAFLPMSIKNNSPIDVHGIKLYLKKDYVVEDLVLPDSFFVGSIQANKNKRVFLPVTGGPNLRSGISRINIRVGNTQMYYKTTTRLVANCVLESIGKARPHLSITSQPGPPPSIAVDTPFEWQVEVSNDGDAPVRNVILEYFPQSCGIIQVGKSSTIESTLSPGAVLQHTFRFKLDKGFLGDYVPLHFRAYSEQTSGLETFQLDTIQLTSTPYPKLTENEDIAIYLTDPSEKFYCTVPLVEKREYIDVGGLIVSRNPISNNRCRGCRILVNGRNARGRTVSLLSHPIVKHGLYYYHFKHKQIYLKARVNNKIQLELEMEGQTVRSNAAYVKSIPIDLHLISIGVPSDLQFTTNDADSIAAAFQSQEGRFYRSVHIKKLNTVANTTKISLASALEAAVNQYKNNLIDTTDVFILFISSHGVVTEISDSERHFRIQPSNFDANREIATSLAYREDIIANYLSRIKCKKLILIDACHSGGKGGFISNKLIEHMNKPAGEVTLASCEENQKSYECRDSSCSNGIFTQAILDAIYGRVPPSEIDLDGKGTVELRELYEYLRVHVPKLITQEHTSNLQQTPTISDNYRDLKWESLTIFAY